MTKVSLMLGLRSLPKRFWAWFGCISIVVLLCVYSFHLKHYGPGSDYRTGFLLGSSAFLIAEKDNLACLGMEVESLRRGFPSAGCEVRDLDRDSAIQEAMESQSLSRASEDLRKGFEDGWQDENRKVHAQREEQK